MAHHSSSGSDSDVDHVPVRPPPALADSTTPSVVMTKVVSSASTWVNHRLSQALELWHHVTYFLLNLVHLLVSVLVNSFIARTTCNMGLQVEEVIRVLVTRITFWATWFTMSWRGGCENIRTPSTTSCDPSRISWNLKALLRGRLIMFKEIIIASWMYINVISKITIQLLFIFNVFQIFIRASMYNTLYKCEIQNPTIQQTSILFSLNQELRDTIFAKLPMTDIIRLQIVCKDFNKVVTNDTFRAIRKMNEGSFGPNVFYLENNTTYMTWQWMSYDLICQQWKKMPSFSLLPLPDIDLFKDFFVAGGGGLFCIDVGRDAIEELIVYNPLTKQQKTLPQLIYRRRPVLIHIFVEEISNSYKVIVAGCSINGSKNLSRKTKVYDSIARCWIESDDIPGPEFALNDYQTGIYVKDLKTLFCIGFLPKDKGRGILAYNVEKGIWIKNLLFQLPQYFLYNNIYVQTQITIAQLLEYNSEVFLFSEQEYGEEVRHSIYKVQKLEQFGGGGNIREITWKKVFCESRNGSRGLLVYPEYECLAHGQDKFCIFNTIERTGISYTIHYKNDVYTFKKQKMPLFPRLKEGSLIFHTFNPLEFIFHPNFKILL